MPEPAPKNTNPANNTNLELTPQQKSKKISSSTAIIASILVLLIGLITWLTFFASDETVSRIPGIKQSKKSTGQYPEVTAPPKKQTSTKKSTSPPKPIGTGKKGFSINGGNQNAPQFGKSYLDPIDPEQGSEQKIIVNLKNSSPIELVRVSVKTDNQENQVKMSLAEGTDTDGTWEGTWKVNDSYEQDYILHIEAAAANGIQEINMILR